MTNTARCKPVKCITEATLYSIHSAHNIYAVNQDDILFTAGAQMSKAGIGYLC